MTSKPWEGRSVYASGDENRKKNGWVEIREASETLVEIRLHTVYGISEVFMSRDQARTFAGHLLALASRRGS